MNFQNFLRLSTFLLLALSTYAIFWFAPIERTMGLVQKLFYIHVPSAISMFAAFISSGIASSVYIIKRTRIADVLANACAEVGLLFCTIVLITGPLWGKPVWGSFWTWEPRLTTTLILWCIFIAYFLLRQTTEDQDKARMFSAVLALFGCLDIPIIIFAVKLWRGLHPTIIGEPESLPTSMGITLLLSTISILFLAGTLIFERTWKEIHGKRL